MKLRLPKSQSSFIASVRSSSALTSYPINFSGLTSGWVTVIVDLSKAMSSTEKVNPETEETYYEYRGYSPDAAGDYYIADFSITGKVNEGEKFDISYALLCDKIEDAESFVKEQGGVTTVYRYLEDLSKPETEKGECRDENGNIIVHEYIMHDDGTHSLLESCLQCGLQKVDHEPHSMAHITRPDGDLAYACYACGYSKFTENINVFYDANYLDTSATNYFRNTKNGVLVDKDGGFEYVSFSGQGNTAQLIFPRNTADSNATEKAAIFEAGKARYFIIRMRTNSSSMNYTFTFATGAAEWIEGKHNGVVKGTFPRTTSFKVPIALGGDDKWNTYVIDLKSVAPNSWVADENGNHTVYTMYCNIGGTDYSPNVNIEFEYMAFVDNWDEVKAVVSDETVISVTSTGAGNIVETQTKSCVGGHSGNVIEVDGGYRVECAICGNVIKEISVPEEVNFYTDLGAMDKYWAAGTLTKFLYDEENDVLYNRYEGNAASHINITGGTGAGTWTENKYQTGEYVVIKYRMQAAGLDFMISTKDFGAQPNQNDAGRPYYSHIGTRKCPIGLSYWSVALIKIPDTIGDTPVRYTKNSEQEIGIMFGVGNSPYIFDVAYIAIVDSPEEAALLLEEGEVLVDLEDSWNGTITEVMPQEPDSEEPEEGRVYNVAEYGPDKLLTPPENTTGTFDITKMEEDGVSFVRINNMTVNKDNWAAINYLNSSHAQKARYFAMKFRIGDNGLNQTWLKIFTGTTGTLEKEGQAVSFKVVEGGEWCVIVVDILNTIGDKGTYMVKGSDGSYTLRYFAIRPFSNNQTGAVGTDAYMDIAYIKFFEHKSQIKDVVDTETYEWSVDRSTNMTLRTEDNSCVTCSISEMTDGVTYKYSCSSCGKVYKTVTLSEAVKRYYSANEIATGAKNYYPSSGTSAFVTKDGVSYAESKNMLQIIWQRSLADMDGKNSSSKEQHFTESVGNSNYIVVKAKTSGAAGYLWMALSTTEYNSTLKVATENMPGYYKGATNQKDEWVNEETGETEKGVLAGGEYRTSTGYKGVYVIPTGTGTGEWQTFVIDIKALYGDAYAKAEGAEEYIVDTFFMNFGGDVDVSYIAFIEGGWSDIDALVEEETVAMITSADGAHQTVNTADGQVKQ